MKISICQCGHHMRQHNLETGSCQTHGCSCYDYRYNVEKSKAARVAQKDTHAVECAVNEKVN